nr:ATP/GTP-binding protein [Candidatus Sigynarchaeum springense]MDO8119325.1 ATP/GTP-binding protein [Candidatus Sigynarchaeota archaeon]
MFFVYFIGPAGSGKTTLTHALADWIKNASKEISVACVNLDPGCRWLPYAPDVDVRDYVSYDKLMDDYNLGPNGALVAATDMIVTHLNAIKEEIRDTRADYVLVDTPGQIELFSFRVAGPKICKGLGGDKSKSAICFLFEPGLCSEPSGFISTLLLSSAVEYRFFLPHLNLLAKADSISQAKVDEIVEWSEDFFRLTEAIEERTEGLEREKAGQMAQVFNELGTISSLLPVSSKSLNGLDNLYAELQRTFAGGEDYETED